MNKLTANDPESWVLLQRALVASRAEARITQETWNETRFKGCRSLVGDALQNSRHESWDMIPSGPAGPGLGRGPDRDD